VGSWYGGMPERSIDIGDREREIGREEGAEEGGVLSVDIVNGL